MWKYKLMGGCGLVDILHEWIFNSIFKRKSNFMKRLLMVATVAMSMMACNDQQSSTTQVVTDSTGMSRMNADTAMVTTPSSTTTTTSNVYTPSEGDLRYRNGKLEVYKNGQYVIAETDVTIDNGVVVRRNGEVVRDGQTVRIEDGGTVTRAGRFFDKAGEGISDAWDATKKGVQKAGEAIKKAGQKVGEETKKVVN